jgi:SAM-dependent methyltransferase
VKFTGERFVPEEKGTIELEHMHRYKHVLNELNGQKVLDIACGEGYGAALLATRAEKVFGVDIAEEAISHASDTYRSIQNLSFLKGSLTEIPLPDDSIDAITCFESIEHIVEHEEALIELKRVLKDGGNLYMSTPEKLNYSDVTGYRNPYHPKELYFKDFSSLLERHFKYHEIQGQRVLLCSVILDSKGSGVNWQRHPRFEQNDFVESATYLIAKASDVPFAHLGGSVYEGRTTLDDLLFARPEISSFSNAFKTGIKLSFFGPYLISLKKFVRSKFLK